MAKTLLEFDGKLLDVMRLGKAEKLNVWNDEKGDFVYQIMVNEDFPETALIKDTFWEYLDRDYRDKQWELLKRKIGEIEHIILL